MNLSTELYEALCGWMSCVKMNPGESPVNWAARALAMRVDKEIILMEIPREEFEIHCKEAVAEIMKKFTESKQ